MQPKSYEILIDIKRGLMNNQIIEVVTGDFGMNNFKFKLLRDRLVPYDLTNTIVRIMAVTPSGSEQQQDCIVENPAGGTLDLTLKQSLFAESGAYVAELQVYDKDTQVLRVTFPRFDYYVRKSLQNDETVQASDEYSILQQMINDVGDINDNINGRVEAHNTNDTSHENIIGLLSSLTTDEKLNLVSAINEVKSQSNEIATDIESHKADSVHQGINNTVSVTSTNDATSVTDAPLKTAGGLAVAKSAHFGGSVHGNTNGEFLRSAYHREFYYGRLYGYRDFNVGQQLVWKVSLNSTVPSMLRVKFSGSPSTGVAGRLAVVDKLFVVAFDYSNSFRNSESVTYFKMGFNDDDVTIVPTGENNEIKIILKNTISHDITRWTLLISTEASAGDLISVPVLTIENI